MKKIILLFTSLFAFFPFSANVSNANHDVPVEFIKLAYIKGDALARIKLKNLSCEGVTSSLSPFGPADITRVLTFSGNNITCTNNPRKSRIECRTTSGSTGTRNISVNGLYTEIFEVLGISRENYGFLYEKFEGKIFSKTIKIKFKNITTTQSWGNGRYVSVNNDMEGGAENHFREYSGAFSVDLEYESEEQCNSVPVCKNININAGEGIQEGENKITCTGENTDTYKVQVRDLSNNKLIKEIEGKETSYILEDTSINYEVSCLVGKEGGAENEMKTGEQCVSRKNFTEEECEEGDEDCLPICNNINVNSGAGIQEGENTIACSGKNADNYEIKIKDKETGNVLETIESDKGSYKLTDTTKDYEFVCLAGKEGEEKVTSDSCKKTSNFNTSLVTDKCIFSLNNGAGLREGENEYICKKGDQTGSIFIKEISSPYYTYYYNHLWHRKPFQSNMTENNIPRLGSPFEASNLYGKFEVTCMVGAQYSTNQENCGTIKYEAVEPCKTIESLLKITDDKCRKNSDGSYNCYATDKILDCEVSGSTNICKPDGTTDFSEFTVKINSKDTIIKVDGLKVESGKKVKCEVGPTICTGSGCSPVCPNGDCTVVNVVPDPDLENCATKGEFCFGSQPAGSGDAGGKTYANLEDKFTYDFSDMVDSYGNSLPAAAIKEMKVKHCSEFTQVPSDCKGIKDRNNINALVIESTGSGFTVKSAMPGMYSDHFEIQIPKWDLNWAVSGTTNGYTTKIYKTEGKKTFVAPIDIKTIKVSDDNGSTWTGVVDPEAGKQKYRLILNGVGETYIKKSSGIVALNKVDKNNFYGNITLSGSISDVNKNFKFQTSQNPSFSADVIFADADQNLLAGNSLDLQELPISYKLKYSGNNTTYNVGYDISGKSDKSCEAITLGAKIEGTMQGGGRIHSTENKVNYTDLSKANLRTQIRSNAYNLIRSMKSGTKAGTVLYIEGNKNIKSIDNLKSGDTLIIKNGSLTIDEDIIENIGIVVLKDNYSIGDSVGNILIANNVTKINATIYADGGLIKQQENNQTTKQLILDGALFTRNTIGGGVDSATDKYILPGGTLTDNRKLSRKYDLNYIRQMTDKCGEPSFIIRYNPSIQTNPPRGFKN